MAKYVSGRQRNLKVGISSYSENLTSLEVIGNVGIATTNATSRLYVVGDGYFTGVVTATAFYGTFSGNAATATYATNAGIATYATSAGIATQATKLQTPRTFEITGDIVGAAVTFDGTGNVSIAATIQPNSVGLGTHTYGDYVKSITGTSNQISVSVTSGEGSAPTLSIPNQFTIPQDATITRDLQVNRNLNVTGNITIGGTSAAIFAQELKISDPDIVLGFRTDAFGNDVSNDTTANHGGVALASTEGNPLVNLNIAGIETFPVTYKKIMWFKAGAFAGLGTDAWLFNYAVGIGSTQFPTGTRLAAGSVQFTENDLAVVRNINASGIITATTGNLTTANITTGNIVTGIVTTISGTNLNYSGIGTIATLNSTGANLTTANITTGNIVTGVVTSISGTNLNYSGIGTIATLNSTTANITTGNIVTGVVTSISGTNLNYSGIGTIVTLTSTNATLTNINSSGIATVGFLTATDVSVSGIITASIFSTGSTGIGINTDTISGPSIIYIDPSPVGVGTTSGIVRIKGDLYVDGTQFVVNSSTIELADLRVGIATTVGTNLLLDGGGIGIGSANILKTFVYNQSSDSLKSSENLDIGTGKTYKIDGTEVLSATQLTVQNINISGIGTIVTLNSTTANITTGNIVTGIITTISGTDLNYSGIGTIATLNSTTANITTGNIVAGVVTTISGTNLNYSGIGTIATLTSTNATLTNINSSGISTFTNGPVLIGGGTSTGTASQPLQVTGGAYVSGSIGIGTTNPQFKLDVNGDINFNGTFYQNGSQFVASRWASGTGDNIYRLNGNVGVGTTNPTVPLSVIGNANFTGVVTASSFSGNASSSTYADNAGVSTYATSAGIATYATNAGIATNLKGGLVGNIPYQSSAHTTVFLTNGSFGTILQSNGVGNEPTWVSAAPSGAITGITIRDEGDLVGVEGSVTQLDFVGSNISVASTSGIATITVSNNLVGTALSISGISTFNNTLNVVPTASSIAGLFSGTTSSDMVRITQLGIGNALVVEDETNPDATPFVVKADGSVGIGTTNPTSKLYVVGDGYFTGILTANRIISSVYGEFVGGSISGTNIVGTALSITGISTFSNGPVFIGAATSTGTASQPLQVTGGAYVSDNLGIGTANPTSKLYVVGDGYFTGIVTATSFGGSGTNLTGIVTSIVAGTNITVSDSTGQVTINAAGGLDILEVMLFA